VVTGVGLGLVWLVLATLLGLAFFLHSERDLVLASHEATVTPTLTGQAVVRPGAVLPDVRVPTGRRVGVEIHLGNTTANSMNRLLDRYAVIASQPDGQIAKVEAAVDDMARIAAVRGAALATIPIGVWVLLGARRRRRLLRQLRTPRGVAVALALVALAIVAWQPWAGQPETDQQTGWQPLADTLGPGVPVPAGLEQVEVRGNVATKQSRRLIESALDTYDVSRGFYARAIQAAATLEVRQPTDGETVVLLVSDRHDNIGMDRVARAIGERAGATAVFNAGDDTSTGQDWEAFSLDSLDEAFADWPRFGVAGNHDHGGFVRDYLTDLGWTMLDGEPVDGPDGIVLLGVDDPRSSGLGSWRNETGLSYAEVGDRLADAACASDTRVTTILVHDVDLADEALARGCADLAVGGHLHVRVGPLQVTGANGETGWQYTTGTTGGAAYAIAIGSKPRRPADVSLITYRDGAPVGIQSVQLQTNGVFTVSPYAELG